MLPAVTPSTLELPGATLYYEVRGSGPLLLVIPGGPQDAGVFAELAQHLADRYKVVAYDPRGNSRSLFDGAPRELDLVTQADDAAALIRALGGGPAHVFGTSGGAQIGLALAAHHPELVTTLVAHEPPTLMLLDDPSPALAADEALYETYRREGVEAAMAQFFAANALEAGDADEPPPDSAPSPEEAETFARVSRNFEYWLSHGMRPLSMYEPDVEALRNGRPRVVVAIGEASTGLPIAAMGEALARRLGTTPLRFPGDHVGFGPHAKSFAGALHRTFTKQ
jgi:pimeloyl-ACP methyl ester carboxylesterase